MKTRNGFVSNSSSSSFIIKAEGKFSTVKDVARYIIDECRKDGYSNYLTIESELLKKVTKFDTPLFFDTGGDETYIRKYPTDTVGDVIIIATTQNMNFSEINNVALTRNDFSSEFYENFKDEEEDEEDSYTPESPNDFDYYYKKFNDFLILRHGIYGRHEYLDGKDACPYCNRGFSRGWLLKNGDKVCNCREDIIKKLQNVYQRKEKLNKISK